MNDNKESVFIDLKEEQLVYKNNKKTSKTLVVVLCIIFLFVGFVGGCVFTFIVHPVNKADTANTFGEIEALLEKYWIYSNEYDDLQSSLEDKAFYGMTAFENDPYTTYMSAEELNDFASNINMDYVGIGVLYSMSNNKALIERVFVDSPAEKAGLKPGDIIEAVDGISIEGLTSDDIKNLVLGEEGSKVVISVTRNNSKLDVTAIRSSIDSSVYCYADDNYVVMELSSFGNTTGKECMNYLDKYTSYDRIIIDLRNNTGGYQTSVKEIAGLFIGNDKVYLRQADSNGNVTADVTSCSKTYDNFKKYVLLVNGETASAAEVFAICLKEQLADVTIVGETTYGKGVIQSTNYLSNGGVLKFTTFNWYSPNGVSIQNVGIKPDIEVRLSDIAYDYYVEMNEDQKFEFDSVNEIVRICQEGLDFLGYKINRKDGYFDLSFEDALKQYKIDNNLEENGILDEITYQSIISDSVLKLSNKDSDPQFLKAIEIINQ